jgi:large subunit ribosomal protein L25
MELKTEKRESFGSIVARRLRREGKIPAIVYGLGKETSHILLDEYEVRNFLKGHERIVQLTLPSSKAPEEFLLKDIQYNHLGDEICHLDFVRFDATQKALFSVSLEFVGTPEGQKEGGILEVVLREIDLLLPPRHVPEYIRVKVMDFKVGDILRVKDLPLPLGAEYKGDPEDIVAQVRIPEEEDEVAVATGEMPEVITERKKEEPEEEKA